MADSTSLSKYEAVSSLVRDLIPDVASKGLDAAGTAKLGPLWLIVKPAVTRIVEEIRRTPDAAVEKALQKFALEDAKFLENIELAEVILGALKPHHLDTVRRLDSLARMAQASEKSRQVLLRHKLSQVWLIGEAVRHLEQPSFPSPYPGQNAEATMFTHLAIVGVSDGAIRAIAQVLPRQFPPDPPVRTIGSILSMHIHPALQLAFTLGWLGCAHGGDKEPQEIALSIARDFEVEWVVESYFAEIDVAGSPEERRTRTDDLLRMLSEWN